MSRSVPGPSTGSGGVDRRRQRWWGMSPAGRLNYDGGPAWGSSLGLAAEMIARDGVEAFSLRAVGPPFWA